VAPESGRTALPRPLLVFGVPAAAVFLVTLFIFLGFPYDKLGDRIAAKLLESGVRVEFDAIGPALRLAGPGLEAKGLRATLSNGESLQLERAMVRPAWSSAWLRGRPALYTEIDSESGSARGTVVVGAHGGFRGELAQVDAGVLPLAQAAPLGSLDGVVDASVDLAMEEQGPKGRVRFEAADGSLQLPGVPMPIPFATLTGDLDFGDDAYVTVKRLELKGPLLNAGVTGNVLQAASFAAAPLRLEIDINAQPGLVPVIRQAGLRIDRNGVTKARVTGTVGQPKIR